ncbi:hypothetical protein [Pseudomonas sp. SWI36]|uniref:Uncharacterized protein n=1 Tax=Pseudomonas sp. 13.2 TaxID=3144665 RepID=A0AAU7BEJ0_9PSED|nr:hypothetical protein [Pseudomonas sp. SWI36]
MPRIAVIISPDEYDAFATIIGHDPEFPKTYDDWLKRTTKENEQHRARGEVINEVTIHPQEFANWCKACGLDPSYILLGMFAGTKVHR